MSQTYGQATGGMPERASQTETSGWAVGWTYFAAIMMSILGIWWIMSGLVAVFEDEFFVVTEEWVFQFDLTTWGWIHMILGIIILLASIGLYSGAVWARTVGVVVAGLAMIIAFAWLPYYPVWALLFITSSFAVIWALTAHGRDVTTVM